MWQAINAEWILSKNDPTEFGSDFEIAHLRLLDAFNGEAAELALHLAVVGGGAGRDGGRADALVVLGRVLPDQLVGVRLRGKERLAQAPP